MESYEKLRNPKYYSQISLIIIVNFLLIVTTLTLLGLVINVNLRATVYVDGVVEKIDDHRFFYLVKLQNDPHNYYLPSSFLSKDEIIVDSLIQQNVRLTLLKDHYIDGYRNVALYGIKNENGIVSFQFTENYITLYRQLIILFGCFLLFVIVNSVIIIIKWWKTPAMIEVDEDQKWLFNKLKKSGTLLYDECFKQIRKIMNFYEATVFKEIIKYSVIVFVVVALAINSVIILIVLVGILTVFSLIIYLYTAKNKEKYINVLEKTYKKILNSDMPNNDCLYLSSVDDEVSDVLDFEQHNVIYYQFDDSLIPILEFTYHEITCTVIDYRLDNKIPMLFFLKIVMPNVNNPFYVLLTPSILTRLKEQSVELLVD